ncbi:MAG: MFS transporter, partial [Promethearchaeota archaeon]
LLVFGVFLGLNFICMSLIDVCIDKTLLENSPTEKVKNNNTLFVRLGLMMGALFPILTFLVLFSNSYYIDSWALFFFISFFTIMPLLFIAPFISIDIEMPDNTSTLKDNDITDKINAKSIFCMCIFMFLLYALRLYEYPFEPWVLKKYFHGNYMYFSLFIFTMVIMNTLGLIIAGIVSHKHDRRKILMISVFLYGILTIIAPFTNLIMFLILASQIQFIAGFVLINSMMMTIDLSKKKVMYFQIIMSFAILANVVFIPLGTYLSIYIQTEFIAMLAGIIILFSLIPLIFITNR